MANGNVTPEISLSPASKDWRTLREELFARAPIITGGRWTDLNASDPGVAIAEMLIAMQDQLLYYLDRQAIEAFLPTAVQRRDVQNLLKLIDYELVGSTPGTGNVVFTLGSGGPSPAFPVQIPKGTVVSGVVEGDTTVRFVTTAAATITGYPANVTVSVSQGVPISSPEVFQSDGSANQRFVIRASKVAKDLLVVKVGTSTLTAAEWTAVPNTISYRSNDEVFVPSIGPDGRAYVQFGDGKFGKIPQIGHNVYVYVTQTDGAVGNVAANGITKVVSTVVDAVDVPVRISVTNPDPILGGTDPESIEDGKRKGPALFAALYRAMTKLDHIALAQTIPGVDKVNCWGEMEELHPDIRLMNRVTLVFTASSGGTVVDFSDPINDPYLETVKRDIYDLIEERKPITTRIVFQTPEWVDLLVRVKIAVDRTLYDPTIIAGNVRLALNEFLSYDNVTFGGDARLSQISSIVQGVAGVSWAEVKLGRAYPAQPETNFVVPTFQDIPLSRWELIRVTDLHPGSGLPVLTSDGSGSPGALYPHIDVTTTILVDEPTPDPLPDPCSPTWNPWGDVI